MAAVLARLDDGTGMGGSTGGKGWGEPGRTSTGAPPPPLLSGSVGWRRGKVVVWCSRACPRFPRVPSAPPPYPHLANTARGSTLVAYALAVWIPAPLSLPCGAAGVAGPLAVPPRASFLLPLLCPFAPFPPRIVATGRKVGTGQGGEPVDVSTRTLRVFTPAACVPTRPGEGVGGWGGRVGPLLR